MYVRMFRIKQGHRPQAYLALTSSLSHLQYDRVPVRVLFKRGGKLKSSSPKADEENVDLSIHSKVASLEVKALPAALISPDN